MTTSCRPRDARGGPNNRHSGWAAIAAILIVLLNKLIGTFAFKNVNLLTAAFTHAPNNLLPAQKAPVPDRISRSRRRRKCQPQLLQSEALVGHFVTTQSHFITKIALVRIQEPISGAAPCVFQVTFGPQSFRGQSKEQENEMLCRFAGCIFRI
jgi:hypothetical protein